MHCYGYWDCTIWIFRLVRKHDMDDGRILEDAMIAFVTDTPF